MVAAILPDNPNFWVIDNFAFIDSETIRNEWTLSFSSLFAEEQRCLLEKLPKAYKGRFREAGFFQGRPVLILSPYDVPHGIVRRQWMEAFFKDVHLIDTNPQEFLKQMPYLIHEYQCDRVSPDHSVALAPGHAILTQEEGSEQNMDMLPKRLAKEAQFSTVQSTFSRWTEDDQKLYLGLQHFYAATNAKEAPYDLPWPEPGRDCDAFQFVETKTILIEPAETVDPRGNREFGETVTLLGNCDRPEQVKIIQYHGDFTLVEYSNGQKQWLPLQNQRKVETTITASNAQQDEYTSVKAEPLEQQSMDTDDNNGFLIKKETSDDGNSPNYFVENSDVPPSPMEDDSKAHVENSDVPPSPMEDDSKAHLEVPKQEETTLTPAQCDATTTPNETDESITHKRSATTLPRKAKTQKVESVSLLQNIVPPTDGFANDVAKTWVPPNGSAGRRNSGLQQTSPSHRTNSPPSPRNKRNQYRKDLRDMNSAQLEEVLRKRTQTAAVLSELCRRPWSHTYEHTSIPNTVKKLRRNKNLGLAATQVRFGWDLDKAVREVFVRVDAARSRDDSRGIDKALQDLLDLRNLQIYDAVASTCPSRAENTDSAIKAAEETLNHLGTRVVARSQAPGHSKKFCF